MLQQDIRDGILMSDIDSFGVLVFQIPLIIKYKYLLLFSDSLEY